MKHKLLHGYWTVCEGLNMRRFMDQFAETKGFKSLHSHEWYTGTSILSHFGNSVARALMNVYPQVGFDVNKFSRVPAGTWQATTNRRHFFDQLAVDLHFSPMNQERWYQISMQHIIRRKGGKSVLAMHDGSYVKALMDLYPELHFDAKRFRGYHCRFSTNNDLSDPHIRKSFFDSLAHQYKFDPLQTSEWYSIFTGHVALTKGGKIVLEYYGGSFIKGLLDVYPSMQLEINKFHPVEVARYNATLNNPHTVLLLR